MANYYSPEDVPVLQSKVVNIIQLLKQYVWLTESFVLDFFVDCHWEKLPKCWQGPLDRAQLTFLADWLNYHQPCKYPEVWPLSLLSLRAAALSLSLPRESVQSPAFVTEFLSKVSHSHCPESQQESIEWKAAEEELSKAGGQHFGLNHLCRRHVKPKKQHEIARLAQVVHMVSRHIGITSVLDVGSGQGHLSRLLSFGYGMDVVTIEANGEYVAGAQRFDLQAVKDIRKQMSKMHHAMDLTNDNDRLSCPQHLQLWISEASLNEDIHKVISRSKDSDCHDQNEQKFGIVGLHTCGSLASTILRLFANSPKATALFSVSCCYMKLNAENHGYPMSSFVSSMPGHELSYEAKEVACHAMEMYLRKIRENSSTLKIHCYRATLETLIMKYYPSCKHIGLRSVRHAERMTFSEYAKKALSKVDLVIPESDLCTPHVSDCMQQWKRVIVFYSLRLLLAPVIETLVLLDRVLYLADQGISTCIAPVFDPSLSPRNHILVAIKKDDQV